MQITKCDNIECCGPTRSNIRSILPMGFLPPQKLCKQHEVTGMLTALKLDEKDEHAKFLPLFQNLSLKVIESVDHTSFKEIPYDFYCPSVQSELSSRICATCNIYFASKKVALHAKCLKHSIKKKSSSLKLTSIEANRKKESLCIFEDENTGCAP